MAVQKRIWLITLERKNDRNIRDVLEFANRIKNNYSSWYNCYSIIVLLWNERNRFVDFAEDIRTLSDDDKQSQLAP